MGHSTGCPPVPLTDACMSHCPSHPTIPWDCWTFHGMSTCPSHRCACILLSIPSHDPMGPWDIPLDVHLSLSYKRMYPTVHPIPWDHGTFHGMSTCPSHRYMCVPLSIPFHDPMGSWDIPWDFHLSLSQMRVYPPVHSIPQSHGTMGHSMGCPPVPLTEARVSYCPFHDPMGPWDIPWDVHLSRSQKRVYPTVYPIPRSHGIMGHAMGCPPVPLTEARESSCPSHPTIKWDHGIFHGMSTCPSYRCVCIVLGDIPELSLHRDKNVDIAESICAVNPDGIIG